MAPRPELQAVLEGILESSNVYFQPPPNIQMAYPCIVYKRSLISIQHGDNRPYKHKTRYQVTVIDRDPDSTIHEKVGELPTSSYDRSYTVDNLNHDVYNVFF